MPAHLTFRTATRRSDVRKVRCAVTAGLAVSVLAGLAGCGGSPQASYCDEVKSQQTQLSKVIGAGGEAALLDALPIFRRLQGKAPSDVRADWTTVVDALAGLDKALTAAHVDPKTYDAKHPPAGVSAAQQRAIAAAATTLGSQKTLAALAAVQQQARDVCHTPLSL
ncbi:hypothetical protein [Nocardioides sp.]|jgi:hypothetical protein|uniref:hypothetical protein n=1 Tax=Nocardioides sp. TaxID=35761 RepID=UPI002CC43702|nr:hypothetical protein [Nocardioides sp.]HVX54689.1 hypothetical protein [Nocardioides sp.]